MTREAGQSERPRVAVLIVHYNTPELLARCLAALAIQTHRPDRIVVADNASTRRFETSQLPAEIEWLPLAENIGFAAANNLLLEHVDGCQLVALLNPDAFPEPTWLAELLAAAESLPKAASLGSRQLLPGAPVRLDGEGDMYAANGLAWRWGHGDAPPADDAPREVFSACAAAALYRREAVLELGGFETKFFCYHEDVDLGFRLRLAGWQCYVVPKAVVVHVGGAASVGSATAVYFGQRNLVWTWWRNMPWPLAVRYLPQHVAANLAACCWHTLRGRGRAVWRAKWDALCGLPAVIRERRQSPTKARIATAELRRTISTGWLDAYRQSWRRRPTREAA